MQPVVRAAGAARGKPGRATGSLDHAHGGGTGRANVLLLLPPGLKGLAAWMADDGREGAGHLFSAELQVGGFRSLSAAAGRCWWPPPRRITRGPSRTSSTSCSLPQEYALSTRRPARWSPAGGQRRSDGPGGPRWPGKAGASFGFDRPAGLRLAWPAGPLLIGRWAWGEPGAGVPHAAAYRPGQRLGDLVLAAQRQLGKGRVVVLGDAACLSDRRLPSSYPFIARLLASLAANSDGPLALWLNSWGWRHWRDSWGCWRGRPAGAGSETRAERAGQSAGAGRSPAPNIRSMADGWPSPRGS